jgi:hypothetical protein
VVPRPDPRNPVLPRARRTARSAAQARLAAEAGPADPLRPIGPARLKALRKAIREGRYPTDDDVLGGLERLLGRDDA